MNDTTATEAAPAESSLGGAQLPSADQPKPEGELGPRIVGAIYVLAFVGLTFFLAKAAWKSDLATTNTRLQYVVRLAILAFLYPAVLGGLAIAKGAPPSSAANPLGIPYHPRWWKTLFALTQREALGLFTTPVPYIVYAAWLLLNGFLFYLLLYYYTGGAGNDYQTPPWRLLFDNMFFHLALWLICPALTMRLIAEEKRSGTVEALLTAPVTDIQVVLGKYIGVMISYGLMVATSLVYLAFLASGSSDFDWGPVLATYLGIVLIGGLYLAIGLAASSITDNQIVAFLVAAVVNALLFFANAFEGFVQNETVRSVAHQVSVHTHYQDFLIGLVSTRSVIYFASGILFFVHFAVRGLESQRWK